MFYKSFLLVVIMFVTGLAPAMVCAEGMGMPLSVRKAVIGSSRNPTEEPSITAATTVVPSQAQIITAKGALADYVLGTGDKIKLTVYGEEDLSGEYEVGSTGVIALPLIGDIKATSQTISQFEAAVRTRLASGYINDPRVNAQVINYRPFFILGEVSKPGSYPYVNGMTVLNAVALAGGYSYRAQKDGVVVVRASDPNKVERKVGEDATIMPGDIIRVPERFF